MPEPGPTRRTWLAAASLPWLPAAIGGCASPLPIAPPPSPDGSAAAAARLRDSAEAHGLAAYRRLSDINVGYDGQWRPLIGSLQPEVVDAGFRGSSQEHLLRLPGAGVVVAQSYRGERGRKQVCWRRAAGRWTPTPTPTPTPGPAIRETPHDREDDATGAGADIAVWFNGAPSADPAALDAAALVAEGYGLFLLGPLWLADRGGGLALRLAGSERVDGRPCDVIEAWLAPGLGRVALDRVALCIDRADSVMRRVRFTLEGFAGTRGAVAEVDTFDHQRRFGVLWPMRSFERVVHPIALPAHDWHVSGLDVNRGYRVQDVAGPAFSGLAAAPASPV